MHFFIDKSYKSILEKIKILSFYKRKNYKEYHVALKKNLVRKKVTALQFGCWIIFKEDSTRRYQKCLPLYIRPNVFKTVQHHRIISILNNVVLLCLSATVSCGYSVNLNDDDDYFLVTRVPPFVPHVYCWPQDL